MSAFAFLVGLTTIGVPAAVVLGVSGYPEDQRKQQRRNGKDGRGGGRRKTD